MNNISGYKITKEITTNTVRIALLSNEIIHHTYLFGSLVTLNEFKSNHVALLELTKELKSKLPILIDSEGSINLTVEARKHMLELMPDSPISMAAIVSQSFSVRIVSNIFIGFHKPVIPTSFFSNHESAINWFSNQKLKLLKVQ